MAKSAENKFCKVSVTNFVDRMLAEL